MGMTLLDTGNAPRYFVTGLARVVDMGPNAMFSFYLRRPSPDGDQENVIEVELIGPVEAVGPAFDLAITTLGARTMLRAAGRVLSCAFGCAARQGKLLN